MTTGSGPTATVDRAASRRSALLAALDVLDAGPEERFERITRIARETFGVAGSFINLADESSMTIKSQQFDATLPSRYALEDTFCGRTIQVDGPVVVPDARIDARYADLGFVTGEHRVRFYAGAPLRVGDDGTKLGTLCLIDPEPRTLDPDDVALLEDLARWAERELAAGLHRDRVRRILDSLDPQPVDLAGYEVDGLSIPHETMSGDLRDHRVVDGTLRFTVADVMGKGTGAGILATGIRGALLARTGQRPDQAVAELEAQVGPELSRAESFATLFHAELTPRTGRVDFVDAGHGLVLHVRADGSDSVLRSLDLPIGLHPGGVGRASGSVVLQRGDALVVVTDGVLDLWDGTLGSLGRLAAMYRAADDVPAFVAAVRAAATAGTPDDDITLVVVARDA